MNDDTRPNDPLTPESRMGDALIARGRLNVAQVADIVALQQREHLRFGEAAKRLGYLGEDELQRVLAEQFGYPTALDADASALLDPLAIAHAPFSQEAEAIRQIRANVTASLDLAGGLCVAVVSPHDGEGKTYLASSLAIALAQSSQDTLLINANLRPSGQPELLRVRGQADQNGLSSYLSRRVARAPTRAIPGFPTLAVLDAGPTPPNPLEMLADPALARLLTELRERFRVIVLDTPAALITSDAQVIARQARHAIIVARQHHTRLGELQQLQSLMLDNGVTLLGTVYNTFSGPIPKRRRT